MSVDPSSSISPRTPPRGAVSPQPASPSSVLIFTSSDSREEYHAVDGPMARGSWERRRCVSMEVIFMGVIDQGSGIILLRGPCRLVRQVKQVGS